MRLRITFVCLALAAVIAVGCGSSGGSGSSSGGGGGTSATESSGATTAGDSSSGGDSSGSGEVGGAPLTKAEFITKGDAICAKVPEEYAAKVEALEAEAKKEKKPKPTTVEKNSVAAVPPLEVAIASFEEMTPPKGDEQEAEAIIAALESAAKSVEAKPESELSGPKSPFAEFQKLTGIYGFKACIQL
jgi:hypothetical protein